MADGFIYQSLILVTLILILPKIIPIKTMLIVGAISILGSFAGFFASEAVVNGKAGPASALIEIQSLVLLTLEIVFMDKIPNVL